MKGKTIQHRMEDSLERRFDKNSRANIRPSDVEIIVVSASDTFRRLARTLPTPEDAVLEIGCCTGATTQALAATGAQVVAVDRSAQFIQKLQEDMRGYENAVVARIDGRNIPALVALLPDPTVIFIDIGGDARLDNVALQLRLCLRAFHPRLIVVRSSELATLASLISEAETPRTSGLRPVGDRVFGRDHLSNLLDLSCSTSVDSRVFAVRHLSKCSMPRAHDRLKEMVSDPHPRVRRAAERACQTLGINIGDEGASSG